MSTVNTQNLAERAKNVTLTQQEYAETEMNLLGKLLGVAGVLFIALGLVVTLFEVYAVSVVCGVLGALILLAGIKLWGSNRSQAMIRREKALLEAEWEMKGHRVQAGLSPTPSTVDAVVIINNKE